MSSTDLYSDNKGDMNSPAAQDNQKRRILAIDVFRGFTIAVMVFVNFQSEFTSPPDWSLHAPDYGLTYVDFVAPFFIFALALTYKDSLQARVKKDGGLNGYMHFIVRNMALIGMGFLGTLGIQDNLSATFTWGVLQAIGFAGMITLLFIRLPRYLRLCIAVFGLVMYQFLVLPAIGDVIVSEAHAGFIGGMGWAFMMLLCTVPAEAIETKKTKEILIWGVILLTAGLVLVFFVGVSKHRVNISYTLITIGMACVVYYLIWVIYEKKNLTRGTSRFSRPLGRNSFLIYCVHGPLDVAIADALANEFPWFGVIIIGLVLVASMWLLSVLLDKKKIYIVL